ncbi:Hsp70/Hsp90 organizing protein, putative [Plasmodium vinckei]|uniref:Hsp70-Hsp90 organising protein n=4 Tax=Plasmodium TaxID=5820 RepID=A0A1A8WBB0_PLAOA|nr:STI1-like protein [Plasmodium vinckei petteri]CAD2093236.1 Hsp70/Hsp90 organizing protein, putative [Plasmodium vinckei lentum]CAD2106480.1 Hsp70/Hsp90 organizing protein, putative [Plasmodium vinckei petteri]CAD2106564.1 Hsp70/Hsp90 organizing protein, putative [Plasmodium vinckei]SBS89274.1 Hsp70/Hsp90 organizing protein, putative (HOP) [Plasmodium ovale curtisi]
MVNKEEAQRLKELGNKCFQEGKFDDSVKYFSDAIKNDPSDHVLYSNLSGAYSSLGRFYEALESANKCISIKNDWPKGYIRKACAEHGLRQLDNSEKTYLEGLKLDPNNKSLKDGLEKVRKEKEMENMEYINHINNIVNNDPKLKSYKEENSNYPTELLNTIKAINANPMNIRFILSSCNPKISEGVEKFFGIKFNDDASYEAERERLRKKEEEEKKEKERKMKEEEKKKNRTPEELLGDEHKLKGNELYKQKKFEEALKEYDEAIKVNPNDIMYYYNKAAVYLEMKSYEKSIETCLYAIENRYNFKAEFSQVAKVYNRLAIGYINIKDYDKALEAYRKSLVEDNNRATRNALKELERKKEKEEREAYIDPVKAEEHKNKGNEYFKNNDFPNAKKEYDEAIRRNPNDAKLYSNRAAALTKLIEYPSALEDVMKAIELDPKFVKAYTRKGNLHFFMKDYYKAIQAYNKGLELDPNNKECTEGYQRCVYKIDEMSKSEKVDEEQIKKSMADPEIQQIISDPQFQIILQKINENPNSISEYIKDPKIFNGLQKLIAAGILTVR